VEELLPAVLLPRPVVSTWGSFHILLFGILVIIMYVTTKSLSFVEIPMIVGWNTIC
jgi:hypothetical protein